MQALFVMWQKQCDGVDLWGWNGEVWITSYSKYLLILKQVKKAKDFVHTSQVWTKYLFFFFKFLLWYTVMPH
jgi:hypothetical protein